MLLLIPTQITEKIALLDSVVLQVSNRDLILTSETIKLGSVDLNESFFDSTNDVNFKVTYKDGTLKNHYYSNKNLAIHPKIVAKQVSENNTTLSNVFGNIPPHLLRVNFDSSLENTDANRLAVLKSVKDKANNLGKAKNIKTGKNLVYYTLFDSGTDYVELLARSIESLGSSSEFDVLVFTDELTKAKIAKSLESYAREVKYKVVDTPKDGIEASKIKTRIYDYENINNYENILFLDADTVCIGDIADVFSLKLSYGVLYTAFNKNLRVELHKTSLFHGFKVITDEEYALVVDKNQVPFNAGQYLFKNSSKMKQHFENVNWFMANWPGEYFFEQAFLNHYFCINGLTNPGIFNKKVKLIPAGSMEAPSDDQIILHFIGPALDGKTKLAHIDNYRVKNNI